MSKSVFFTKEGYEKLAKELKHLKNEKRQRAVDRLQKARAMGDLSENSEYTAALEVLAFVDNRVQEIEEILKKAQIINHNSLNQKVEMGSRVTVEIGGKPDVFTIVGQLESDLSEKKLSHASPIGRALMGRKKGDSVEVQTPSGRVVYKIIDVQ